MITANDIIESVLKYHRFDAETHPFSMGEPKTPPAKKIKIKMAKKKVAIEEEHESDDPNDNSIDMDIEEANTAGPSGLGRKKRKLVPQEVMCENNIAEREFHEISWWDAMPHSKVRKIWQKSDQNYAEFDDDDVLYDE